MIYTRALHAGIALSLLCAASACVSSSDDTSATASSEAWQRVPASVRMEGYFPNVELVTHEGRRVRFYDDLVKGKIVLVSFMFTACEGICPRTTANLVQVQRALGERAGRDVFIYAITLDPEHDDPSALARYAERAKAGPGFLFLTGRHGDIERLRRKLGVYDPDPAIDADKTQHGGIVVYGNEAIGRWGAVPGIGSAEMIVRALQHVMPKRTS